MRKNKILCKLILILFFPILNYAQKLGVSSEMGLALNSKAYGSNINIGVNYYVNPKNTLSFSLGQSFLNSDNYIPDDLQNSNFHLRDNSNIAPIGLNPAGWDEDAFPGYNLRSKPNRYFNFYLSMKYSYTPPQTNTLKIGMGIDLSYFDIMEITKVVKLKKVDFILPIGVEKQDYNVPIFLFDTYYDAGVFLNLNYKLFNFKRLEFEVNYKMTYYPLSSNIIYTLGSVLSWQKNI